MSLVNTAPLPKTVPSRSSTPQHLNPSNMQIRRWVIDIGAISKDYTVLRARRGQRSHSQGRGLLPLDRHPSSFFPSFSYLVEWYSNSFDSAIDRNTYE